LRRKVHGQSKKGQSQRTDSGHSHTPEKLDSLIWCSSRVCKHTVMDREENGTKSSV
jgi:hypothetical protein